MLQGSHAAPYTRREIFVYEVFCSDIYLILSNLMDGLWLMVMVRVRVLFMAAVRVLARLWLVVGLVFGLEIY